MLDDESIFYTSETAVVGTSPWSVGLANSLMLDDESIFYTSETAVVGTSPWSIGVTDLFSSFTR